MKAYVIVTADVAGRPTWLALPAEAKQPLPVLYTATGKDFSEEMGELAPPLAAQIEAETMRPFALAAFSSSDWNRELTPWPAPGLSKKAGDFAGEAPQTLAWLMESFVPHVEADPRIAAGRPGRSIFGYSLSGLFALWACTQTQAFAACASCSGSLWYDGWDAYFADHPFEQDTRIYLSLGDREGHTRYHRMAAVDAATRATAARLEADAHVVDTALQWQAGGHFDGVPGRLSDAIAWLMHP